MSYFKNPILRLENALYTGSNDRKSLFDVLIPENFNGKLIVFVHGYKGFKDWGAWNLVEFHFVDKGFGFAKLNLSHNGGTTTVAKDFPDLEAFGQNTYSKEIDDIRLFLDHLETLEIPNFSAHLIGHSRGGGNVILSAAEDERICSFATWAAIATIPGRMPQGEVLRQWKEIGVRYEMNTRTGQQMPIYYSLYEDVVRHADRLDIENACTKIRVPRLIIHGTNDEAVSIEEGKQLSAWLNTPLIEIPLANHTFGSKHPWETFTLPKDLKTVVDLSIRFFDENLG